MEPWISIIVPVFNVENYLRRCVDSLINQSCPNLEIILVDDGSTDKSGKMADMYAQRCSQIKVIHQENAGQGLARNEGVALASGEYVGFVDSDDWVNPEMFETLYEAARTYNADIVVGGMQLAANDKILSVKVHPMAGQTLTSRCEIAKIRKNFYGYSCVDKETELFPNSVCTSLYRRSMVQKHKISFRNILSEDALFNLDAFGYANVITFIPATDYFYRQENQTSSTRTFTAKKRQRFAEFLIVLKDLAEQENDAEYLLRTKRMAIDYCRAYVTLVGGSRMTFREKIKEIREFVQIPEVESSWKGYPIQTLPIKQRLLHWLIMKKLYGIALCLDWIRHFRHRGYTNQGK